MMAVITGEERSRFVYMQNLPKDNHGRVLYPDVLMVGDEVFASVTKHDMNTGTYREASVRKVND
jgi:hypothetical protein